MKALKQIVILLGIALFCVSCSKVPSVSYNPWHLVATSTESTLQDVGFTGDLNHGWAVGSNATLLETKDGGTTWQEKGLELLHVCELCW